MKIYSIIKRLVSLPLITLSLVLSISCDNESPITEAQKKTQLLTSSPWTLHSVLVDGVDYTSSFEGMTVQFSPSSYTTSNGGAIWLPSGNWEFKKGSTTIMILDTELEVGIQELDDESLKVSLYWSETSFSTGRRNSVEGMHVFQFIH